MVQSTVRAEGNCRHGTLALQPANTLCFRRTQHSHASCKDFIVITRHTVDMVDVGGVRRCKRKVWYL